MARTHKDVQADIDAAKAKARRLRDDAQDIIDRATGEDRDMSEGELMRHTRLVGGIANAMTDVERFNDEYREILRTAVGRGATESGGVDQQINDRRAVERDQVSLDAVRSSALRQIDRDRNVSTAVGDRLNELIRTDTEDFDGGYIAERLLITETDAYRSAWMQKLLDPHASLSGDEAMALRRLRDLDRRYGVSRAMNEGTTTAGGFGVPVYIDPSIIVTSGAADVPILQVARIEQITNQVWKGVSSAGMTWSFDGEATEVSDDSPTLAQPLVTAYMARGFIPHSVEVGMDYPNFAQEMGILLAQGYTDLLAAKTMTGSGTAEPWGVFTRLDATASSEVVVTTDGSFGAVDVLKVWNALPERYRNRAAWTMSVSVESAIRGFASAAGGSSSYFTIDLSQGGLTRLNGRPVVTTDYAPSFASSVPGTTGAANILAVGDFRQYIVASRAGMSVEQIPHLFGASGRPTSQRGFLAWARVGADIVNTNGVRLLQNQ